MLYALLIYERPDDFARRDSPVESEAYAGAWRAYHRALLDAGIFVGGKPLDAPETATTVRFRESKREIQDGPYANTKEQLGGILILVARDMKHAVELMSKHPGVRVGGPFEIRPADEAINELIVQRTRTVNS